MNFYQKTGHMRLSALKALQVSGRERGEGGVGWGGSVGAANGGHTVRADGRQAGRKSFVLTSSNLPDAAVPEDEEHEDEHGLYEEEEEEKKEEEEEDAGGEEEEVGTVS